MTTTQPDTGAERFDGHFHLPPAEFADVAAVLPVIEPVPDPPEAEEH